LLDECHKLTNDGQNALLKLLENPPEHVYFILATTDPQKLLGTIKGRCSCFQVNTLTDKEMYKLLRSIVKGENEILEKVIYEQIILDAQGHPRNAITTLEQVLAVESEKRLNIAKKSAEEQSQAIELCRALISFKSWKNIRTILNGLKGQDAETIRRVLLGYSQAILLKGENDRAALIMEEFLEPLYNVGFPGLVYNCYSIVNNK
jgi:DNA polymerase III gamma/tau subunit